jgi:hypothetical protein
MPTNKILTLPAEVAQKYRLKHSWEGNAKQYFGRFGWVDITTLTLAQADSLYAKGWRKIELKPAPKAAPAAATEKGKKE